MDFRPKLAPSGSAGELQGVLLGSPWLVLAPFWFHFGSLLASFLTVLGIIFSTLCWFAVSADSKIQPHRSGFADLPRGAAVAPRAYND